MVRAPLPLRRLTGSLPFGLALALLNPACRPTASMPAPGAAAATSPAAAERPSSVDAADASDAFPAAWVGDWTGRLYVQRGRRTLQEADMTLAIRPLDSAGCYTWRLAYAQVGPRDVRPYVVCPADTLGEHWRIDERNGIVLDAYVLGGALYSRFEVMGGLLLTRDELRGDTLFHEIVSGGTTAGPTGDTVLPKGDTIPLVGTYGLSSRQVARLVRAADGP